MALKLKFPWNYQEAMPVKLRGSALVQNPMLNKSSAFTADERVALGLEGLLPTQVNSIEEQARRVYPRIHRIRRALDKYVALAALQDRNEHLFHRVLWEHLEEFMPIVYTPTVGLATANFSQVFERGRGLWITPDMKGRIRDVLQKAVSQRYIALMVVTDNESILGIGDQGAGGMAISVGKLALYTACAGIHPASVLPVSLDVGTNNQKLLDDPLYLGWRHPRLRGHDYEEVLEEFVMTVAECFPGAVLQWEDFSKDNALRILDRFRGRVPSFNDDIQGTGAVALAGIYSACRVRGDSLKEQRIVIYGAGAAGLGIYRQIKAGLKLDGADEKSIAEQVVVLDSRGMLVDDRDIRDEYKRDMAWSVDAAVAIGLDDPGQRGLVEVVAAYKPTVLIGASGQAGAFGENIIREMARHTERPVVLPFSNPTAISEAVPRDILAWTDGKALVATGSPFDAVEYNGRVFEIGQGNNVFIFPGIGLGTLLSKADKVSDAMISVSANALANSMTDEELSRGLLFPAINRLRDVAANVAVAVMQQAAIEGNGDDSLANASAEALMSKVRSAMWVPAYTDYIAVE